MHVRTTPLHLSSVVVIKCCRKIGGDGMPLIAYYFANFLIILFIKTTTKNCLGILLRRLYYTV